MKEYKLKINSNDYHVVVSGLSNGRADVMVNGQSYSVEIADAGAASDAGKSASAPAVTATAPAPAAKPAAGGAVKSPLPGFVLDIQVAVGDRVGTGQRRTTSTPTGREPSRKSKSRRETPCWKGTCC